MVELYFFPILLWWFNILCDR